MYILIDGCVRVILEVALRQTAQDKAKNWAHSMTRICHQGYPSEVVNHQLGTWLLDALFIIRD
jgi:hypothetical protein